MKKTAPRKRNTTTNPPGGEWMAALILPFEEAYDWVASFWAPEPEAKPAPAPKRAKRKKKVAARRPTQAEMAARLASAIASKEELDRILAEMTARAAAERRVAEETRYNASSQVQVDPITQVVEVAAARKKAKATA